MCFDCNVPESDNEKETTQGSDYRSDDLESDGDVDSENVSESSGSSTSRHMRRSEKNQDETHTTTLEGVSTTSSEHSENLGAMERPFDPSGGCPPAKTRRGREGPQ